MKNQTIIKSNIISRRLYVTAIPKGVRSQKLRDIFKLHGKVIGCKVMDDEHSDSKQQAAYITFESKKAMSKALGKQGSFRVSGKKLKIRQAPPEKHHLFVGGYDINTSYEQIQNFFAKFGEVDTVKMKLDKDGKSRCFGFITIVDAPDAVKNLVQERYFEFNGKIIEITKAIKPDGKTRSTSDSNSFNGIPIAKRDVRVQSRNLSWSNIARPESQSALRLNQNQGIESKRLSETSFLQRAVSRETVEFPPRKVPASFEGKQRFPSLRRTTTIRSGLDRKFAQVPVTQQSRTSSRSLNLSSTKIAVLQPNSSGRKSIPLIL